MARSLFPLAKRPGGHCFLEGNTDDLMLAVAESTAIRIIMVPGGIFAVADIHVYWFAVNTAYKQPGV